MTAALRYGPSVPAPRAPRAERTARAARTPRHPAVPAAAAAPVRRGRHARADAPHPVAPNRPISRTQPLSTVEQRAVKWAKLPLPERAGAVIRHPVTGAIAVCCDSPYSPLPVRSPGAERGIPCFAVVTGHADHGGHLFLTYREALVQGWEQIGDVTAA